MTLIVAEILYAGEMRSCWIALVLAACTPAKDPATPKLDIAATALATMDRDAPAMLELIRALHLEAGVTVAANLSLDLGKLDDTRASYDDTLIRITLPTPSSSPDEARAYWQAWGKLTSWESDQAFADDIELSRLARYAVFVALAHEVGHFLHHSYVGVLEPGPRELLADRLAIALLDRLATRPELADLLSRYRALLTRWYAAIPDDKRVVIPEGADLDAFVAKQGLPSDPAAAASLSIARQLRLLAKPPKLKALIAETLLVPHDARLAKIEYGSGRLVVTTGRDAPAGYESFSSARGELRDLATTQLDADGKFQGIVCSGGVCVYAAETGASSKLAIVNVFGAELAAFQRVHDAAIVSDKLWLLLGNEVETEQAALTIIDLKRPDAARQESAWQQVKGGRLAVSPSGAVSVMLLRSAGWTVERFEPQSTNRPSWTFKLADGGDADGKNGSAGGALGDCTANDAGTIYCTAGVRIRVLEKDRLWTLAGGVARDWIDATDPRKVAFTSPVRIRATREGLQLVDRKYADDGTATWKIREIALRK